MAEPDSLHRRPVPLQRVRRPKPRADERRHLPVPADKPRQCIAHRGLAWVATALQQCEPHQRSGPRFTRSLSLKPWPQQVALLPVLVALRSPASTSRLVSVLTNVVLSSP